MKTLTVPARKAYSLSFFVLALRKAVGARRGLAACSSRGSSFRWARETRCGSPSAGMLVATGTLKTELAALCFTSAVKWRASVATSICICICICIGSDSEYDAGAAAPSSLGTPERFLKVIDFISRFSLSLLARSPSSRSRRRHGRRNSGAVPERYTCAVDSVSGALAHLGAVVQKQTR